ncbi:MAG TPA: type II toxin-antitoxin system RelE/ParE family toxin [Tepidisphaeraceae bacterium]|nr:type II toxin-antitoxin system RelE/ParE family toxin [Tepidisphaeraceae bacterium]
MSCSFLFTPEAEGDVLGIWEFIADDDSVKSADRVIARIYDECQRLGDMPGMGHFREDLLDKRHKFWSVWSYLIVYRWEAKPIQIIAIVHGARDLDLFFGRPET